MSEEKFRLSSPSGMLGLLVGALIALLIAAGFGIFEHNTAHRLAAQNELIGTTLSDTRAQVETLNSRLNSLAAASQPAPVVAGQIAPAADARTAPIQVRVKRPPHVRRDDPRWKKFQAQLDEQGKQIDQTRQDLTSSHDELQGSIARTHDELVVLQRKGERNYYEFDLGKSKQFDSKGPVGIRLKKANTKQQFADLELMVEDTRLGQKHVNLYQPVMFYAEDGGRPVELVINKIDKDHIHGYVSSPKYRQAELTAMAGSGNSAASNGGDGTKNAPPSQRKKLEVPK